MRLDIKTPSPACPIKMQNMPLDNILDIIVDGF